MLKFNLYKTDNQLKLRKQITRVVYFLMKRYNYKYRNFDIGYINDDFLNNKSTLRIFYYNEKK